MGLRVILAMAIMGLLAACGADGAPNAPAPGVSLQGEARMGVTGKI